MNIETKVKELMNQGLTKQQAEMIIYQIVKRALINKGK